MATSQVLLRKAVGIVTLAIFATFPGLPLERTVTCGSHRDRLADELHLHRRSEAQRRGRGGGIGLQSAPVSEKRPATRLAGELVLMSDSDGVVARRNQFNLDRSTITFTPITTDADRYRFSHSQGSYDTLAADAGDRIQGLADDDSREFTLPFSFPFYGSAYGAVHVNSDGNITFGESDTNIDPRTLDRVTSGPARIAGLYRDLDPTQAVDGVRVLIEANRAVFSWVQVPQWSSFGRGALQTFQIRIHADGRIELAYNGINTTSAIVGISPGSLLGETRIVTFLEGSDEEFSGTIAERFTSIEEVDIILASQKFYSEHDDAYDYLIFYNNMGIDADLGTVAFEITLRNQVSGIGDRIVDRGNVAGSPRRLQAFINMGPLRQYPDDPNGLVPRRAIAGDTPLTVIGHEAGHRFLAFASVRDPGNPDARPMLGRDGAHWNFAFNSEASLLEGNRICDRERTPGACPSDPEGRRFVTTDTVEGYSPLDQYLMGLRPPWEVPDTFLVEDSTLLLTRQMPQSGVNFDGRRRDIRVEEVIAAEGRRTPDYSVSQRRFRLAFILVHSETSEPSAEDIEKADRFRREFEGFFRQTTNGRGVAVTSIRRSLGLSPYPATGILLNSAATATVTLESPASADLDVLLTSSNGAVQVPASAKIPAGESTASFSMIGVREGVDTITAEIPGDGFEQARAHIQVQAAASALRLMPVSGHRQVAIPGQPLPDDVVVRVIDGNNLPYSGVTLAATSSGEGSVTPATASTDANGEARFRWTPDQAEGRLTVTIPDTAGAPVLTISTTGEPGFGAAGVVNAATFAQALSPGSLGSIFGSNLAAGLEIVAGLPSPTELEGIQVLIDGQPAPLLYVSDRQINFVVPLAVAPGPAVLVVTTPLGDTPSQVVSIARVSPGIFVMPDSGIGAVAIAGTGKLTSERPAAPGDFLEIYCTGLGALAPSSLFSLPRTLLTPEVTVAGLPAQVVFSGLAPGFLGLYQVNVRVPEGVPAGLTNLSLVIDGVESNAVPIVVR